MSLRDALSSDLLLPMSLKIELYADQLKRWPRNGRHILAQFDEESVVVYQAYGHSIGTFAASHGYFGGDFKFTRMSWIKPNFLWMMYRSGWGTKPGQEVTLAIRMQRDGFDNILAQAVHSTFVPEVYSSHEAWKERLALSPIRLQWDPDHDPHGTKQDRRAIQLGLSGEVLKKYAREWVVDIEDISDFVTLQREHALTGNTELVTPQEEIYPVRDEAVFRSLQLSEA